MNNKLFSRLVFVQIILLIIQFMLGMDVNLYVNVPTTLNAAFWTAPGTWIIRFHMIVGTIILIIAAYLVLKGRQVVSGFSRRVLFAGLFWIAIAYMSGLAFLFGSANNIYSFLMAISFVFAILSYMLIAGAIVGKAGRFS